jgi:hypothetical protein
MSRRSPECPELDALLALARTEPERAHLDHVNWLALVRLARKHHVTPLVHKSAPAAMPDELRAELASAQAVNVRRNLSLMGELIRLLKLFEEHAITAVPFKGPVLTMQAYGDLSLRQCGDLDILIRPADVRKAKRLLLDRGHELMFPNATPRECEYLASMNEREEARYLEWHSEYHLIRQHGRLNIDLHWRINPIDFCLPFDEASLWSRLGKAQVVGREILSLSPTDTLLVLCCNGAKDCWKRLDRICDIAELLHRNLPVDWDSAIMRADSMNARRVLLLGLSLAHELLDAPLPTELLQMIRREPLMKSLVRRIRRDLAVPVVGPEIFWQVESSLFHLGLRESWLDRARYCVARLNPTVGDWTAVPLPEPLSFLYYILRPVRLAGRIGLAKVGID